MSGPAEYRRAVSSVPLRRESYHAISRASDRSQASSAEAEAPCPWQSRRRSGPEAYRVPAITDHWILPRRYDALLLAAFT